jgi:hypothetical protein
MTSPRRVASICFQRPILDEAIGTLQTLVTPFRGGMGVFPHLKTEVFL